MVPGVVVQHHERHGADVVGAVDLAMMMSWLVEGAWDTTRVAFRVCGLVPALKLVRLSSSVRGCLRVRGGRAIDRRPELDAAAVAPGEPR